MRTLYFFICVTLILPTAKAQEIDSKNTTIAITHVNVVPMDTDTVILDQTVVIEKGKVVSMGKDLKHTTGAFVVDGRGKYLIPGLAEMHGHIPPVDDIEPMKPVLALFALNGITTVRGMLGHPKHLEVREKLKKGEIFGPQLFTTGPSLNGISVQNPQSGAASVRNQSLAGYDYLKLHPGLTRAKFDSIAATAKRVGIPFVGHISHGVGIWRAIDARYSSIDHLDGFIEGMVPGIETRSEQELGPFGLFIADQADTTKIPILVSEIRENEISIVPTQALAERWFSADYNAESFRSDKNAKYVDQQTIEQWITSKKNLRQNPAYTEAKAKYFVALRRKIIKACHDGGVQLLLGCDAPQVFNVPGFSTHQELTYLVKAGLRPYDALKTGTVNVAKYLNRPEQGIIRKGAVADLILLNGNPLADISQTQNIEGVMIRGKWLSKSEITAQLKTLEK